MIRGLDGKFPKIHPSVFVSEAAYIVGDVTIGEGSSVWPNATIRADYGDIIVGKKLLLAGTTACCTPTTTWSWATTCC